MIGQVLRGVAGLLVWAAVSGVFTWMAVRICLAPHYPVWCKGLAVFVWILVQAVLMLLVVSEKLNKKQHQ